MLNKTFHQLLSEQNEVLQFLLYVLETSSKCLTSKLISYTILFNVFPFYTIAFGVLWDVVSPTIFGKILSQGAIGKDCLSVFSSIHIILIHCNFFVDFVNILNIFIPWSTYCSYCSTYNILTFIDTLASHIKLYGLYIRLSLFHLIATRFFVK